ncbi:hypothetical protein INR49_006868, partial [Caranx melampygus]
MASSLSSEIGSGIKTRSWSHVLRRSKPNWPEEKQQDHTSISQSCRGDHIQLLVTVVAAFACSYRGSQYLFTEVTT